MSDQTTPVLSESEKKKEDWMNAKWRPMMGWSYMVTCICDFVLFPVLWSILQAFMHVTQIAQWQPLTLQGAGLYHLAMGAVLGIAALGRTQEKIAGANNGGAAPVGGFSAPTPSTGFQMPAPSPMAQPSGFSSPVQMPVAAPVAYAPPVSAMTASGKKIIPEIEQPLL
jgi:hypothetical protein